MRFLLWIRSFLKQSKYKIIIFPIVQIHITISPFHSILSPSFFLLPYVSALTLAAIKSKYASISFFYLSIYSFISLCTASLTTYYCYLAYCPVDLLLPISFSLWFHLASAALTCSTISFYISLTPIRMRSSSYPHCLSISFDRVFSFF